MTKYPADFVGRYHGLTSELQTVNITPALSWRASETLSLGAGMQIQYADARISNAVDFGAVLAGRGARVAPGSADGRLTLQGDDVGYGWHLGAQWRPIEGTQLGLAWRSAIHHTLEGTARFEGVPASLTPGFREGGAAVKITTPESVGIGLSQVDQPQPHPARRRRVDQLVSLPQPGGHLRQRPAAERHGRELAGHRLPLPGWRVSLQREPHPTQRRGLGQIAGPRSHPHPAHSRQNRYWLSAGLTWEVTPSLAVSTAYTHIFGIRRMWR